MSYYSNALFYRVYIVPGYVCMHAHGGGGHDFNECTEEAFRAAGIHVELAGSFIVLHVCVLSALRHLYSCDLCDTVFFLIRFRTHSRQGRALVFVSEENKKSEPFSYREKVRIFMVWCE